MLVKMHLPTQYPYPHAPAQMPGRLEVCLRIANPLRAVLCCTAAALHSVHEVAVQRDKRRVPGLLRHHEQFPAVCAGDEERMRVSARQLGVHRRPKLNIKKPLKEAAPNYRASPRERALELGGGVKLFFALMME